MELDKCQRDIAVSVRDTGCSLNSNRKDMAIGDRGGTRLGGAGLAKQRQLVCGWAWLGINAVNGR